MHRSMDAASPPLLSGLLQLLQRAGDLVAADEGDAFVRGELAQERDELLRVGEARAVDERVEAAEELGGFERLALDGDLELEDEDGLVGGAAVLVGEGEGVRVRGVVELGGALAAPLPQSEARLAVARVGALALIARGRVEELEGGPARRDALQGGGRELEGLGRLLGVGAALEADEAAARVVVLDVDEVDEEVGLLELVSVVRGVRVRLRAHARFGVRGRRRRPALRHLLRPRRRLPRSGLLVGGARGRLLRGGLFGGRARRRLLALRGSAKGRAREKKRGHRGGHKDCISGPHSNLTETSLEMPTSSIVTP